MKSNQLKVLGAMMYLCGLVMFGGLVTLGVSESKHLAHCEVPHPQLPDKQDVVDASKVFKFKGEEYYTTLAKDLKLTNDVPEGYIKVTLKD